MPRLQIDLDAASTEALASLAGQCGTTPAAFVAELVMQRVHVSTLEHPADPLDALVGSMDADPPGRKLAPPDSIDALIGRYDEEPGDFDEVSTEGEVRRQFVLDRPSISARRSLCRGNGVVAV